MADIFVSYARADKARVAPLVSALETHGFSIWWDPEIAPGQEFDRLIAAALDEAKAVVVVWTPISVDSRWVRGEAREAADRSVLVPVRFENARLPIDARSLHTTDIDEWREDIQSLPFQALLRALSKLVQPGADAEGADARRAKTNAPRLSICVLPFSNMSEDTSQEFFSDGITEDIITDLSKVSALAVSPRNTAFTYKGKAVNIAEVGRALHVHYVLEGSVRKAGNRLRITAQLNNCYDNSHVWAERFDRDLSDIFALQDEISRAVVTALKLKLLPEEGKVIGKRGTTNAEAYELLLLSRKYAAKQSPRYSQIATSLLKKAVDLDPNYAAAWARLAAIQASARSMGADFGDPEVSLKHALELDPSSGEAHATRARFMADAGRMDEAAVEIEIALALDPDSYEVSIRAATIAYLSRRYIDAARLYERTVELLETDFSCLSMLAQCYKMLGDVEAMTAAARLGIARAEMEIATDPSNGDALAHGAILWQVLGDAQKCKEWSRRALLIDPDNSTVRYNIACSLIQIGEIDTALDYLAVYFEASNEVDPVTWAKQDSDLDPVRDNPRFQAMLAAAEKRLTDSTS